MQKKQPKSIGEQLEHLKYLSINENLIWLSKQTPNENTFADGNVVCKRINSNLGFDTLQPLTGLADNF